MPKLSKFGAVIVVLGLIGSVITIYAWVLPWQISLNYPPQLTQDELSARDMSMISSGWNVTQHMTYTGANPDGSRQYHAQTTNNSRLAEVYLYEYKDNSKAVTRFSNEIKFVEGMGYSEKISNATDWAGLKVLDAGKTEAVFITLMPKTSSGAYPVMVDYIS